MIPDSVFRISITSGPNGPFVFGPYLSFIEASKLIMEHMDILINFYDIKEHIDPLNLEASIDECVYNPETKQLEIIDVRAREIRTSGIRIHHR